MAGKVGRAAGVVRGAGEAVSGLVKGAEIIGRWAGPPTNLEQRYADVEAVVGAASRGVDYAKRAAADPTIIPRDVRANADRLKVDLWPGATPVAPTVREEMRRQFAVGMNQGELTFDVGSLALGGPLAKSVKELGAFARAPARAEKYLEWGVTPAQAGYLAEPYPVTGKGHHFAGQRYGLPDIFSESDFNVLKPKGISRGDFYELHYKVDPHSHGANFPKSVGGSWSGRRSGLEKYGPVGRIWFGSPGPLKARVGGTTTAAGSAVQDASGEENEEWD